ncbi:sulfite dehydrogenase [Granulosicoccus antarcticus]|uniref:Sulfoxide reductase catalytic subunit YedY n=1 Tax=Granulosicoccus antarcticus IMCC3135 TaxID=1192854 RepID=A0A2Z2NR92_9GAMM|nr:sulfite dehydrogenase [Granulosicoccus antarcticus]ASJ73952.1 hypothetical protein IMCC3135_19365 [Granulosicoccus antarcticus IMCC3135]
MSNHESSDRKICRESEQGKSVGLPTDPHRRNLLSAAVSTGSALVMTSMVAQAQASDPLPIPQWTKTLGDPVLKNPYGLPSPFEKAIIRRETLAADMPGGYNFPTPHSYWSTTPLQDLRGTITPNGLFYERHHAGVPAVEPSEHRLVVHGLVKRELIFTMDQLRRLPTVSSFHFLECSGNGDMVTEGKFGKNVADIHGLLSCAQWTGVKLSTLLEEAGVEKDKARYVLAEGADSAAMLRTIPFQRAMDECIVVYAQNGENLRPEQGYPVRLLVPGCEGNLNIKWLRRLEVTDNPAFSREETSKYSDLTGPDGMAHKSTLIMEAKSVITFPSGGQELPEAGYYQIRGIAWTGRGKITGVDVSMDGGKNWEPANLTQPVLSKCLTEFTLPWRWDKTSAVLMSRATDETGYVQPFIEQLFTARGKYFLYHNNAIQPWLVQSDGSVVYG